MFFNSQKWVEEKVSSLPVKCIKIEKLIPDKG